MSDNKDKQNEHWEEENSLTAPADRNPDRSYLTKLRQGKPVLTDNEAKEAMTDLNNTGLIKKYPKVERNYADPPLTLQQYALFSFVPAKGATPDKDGVFGFAKIRGSYATQIEANERAEYLIRNIDSYHQIQHTYVGRPFPITLSSKYAEEVTEIDLKKKISETVSQDIKQKKYEEQKELQDMKEREEKLLQESKNAEAGLPGITDPYEIYTEKRVKLAQVSWTYLETEKKMKQMQDIILKTKEEIDKMEKESEEYKKQYFERYMKARKQSNLPDENIETSFMKYMVEDYKFDFLPKKGE